MGFDYIQLLETDWVNQFDEKQLEQIKYGLEQGVNVGVYASPEFNWEQMLQLRRALADGIDVSLVANPELTGLQMWRTLNGPAYRK